MSIFDQRDTHGAAACEVVKALGTEVGPRIYAIDGGARSEVQAQIRADILGRELARTESAGAAMGSAVVAASRRLYADRGAGRAEVLCVTIALLNTA